MINPKTKKKLLEEYFKVWGHIYKDEGMSVSEIAEITGISTDYMAREEINDIAIAIESPLSQARLVEKFTDEYRSRQYDRSKYLTGSLYSYDEIMLSASLALILLEGENKEFKHIENIDMSKLYSDRINKLLR